MKLEDRQPDLAVGDDVFMHVESVFASPQQSLKFIKLNGEVFAFIGDYLKCRSSACIFGEGLLSGYKGQAFGVGRDEDTLNVHIERIDEDDVEMLHPDRTAECIYKCSQPLISLIKQNNL